MASLEDRTALLALSRVTSVPRADLGGKGKGSFVLQTLVHSSSVILLLPLRWGNQGATLFHGR